MLSNMFAFCQPRLAGFDRNCFVLRLFDWMQVPVVLSACLHRHRSSSPVHVL